VTEPVPIRPDEANVVPNEAVAAMMKELMLLRAIARFASAYLNAPYLEEHTDDLRSAVKRWHDWKVGKTT
jgi:hypothetical protein